MAGARRAANLIGGRRPVGPWRPRTSAGGFGTDHLLAFSRSSQARWVKETLENRHPEIGIRQTASQSKRPRYAAVAANIRALHGPGRQAHLVCAWLRATRHATRSCQLPCGCLRTRDSGYPRYARDVASNARQEQEWGYVVPSPPLECSEEPRGPPYHHGYAARHGSTCACQFSAQTNSGGPLARTGN